MPNPVKINRPIGQQDRRSELTIAHRRIIYLKTFRKEEQSSNLRHGVYISCINLVDLDFGAHNLIAYIILIEVWYDLHGIEPDFMFGRHPKS